MKASYWTTSVLLYKLKSETVKDTIFHNATNYMSHNIQKAAATAFTIVTYVSQVLDYKYVWECIQIPVYQTIYNRLSKIMEGVALYLKGLYIVRWLIQPLDQTLTKPGRRELPTQSYIRPPSWLDTNLSRQEPEEEDLVPASSDEGLWQRSKRQKVNNFLVGFDEFCISMFNSTKWNFSQ